MHNSIYLFTNQQANPTIYTKIAQIPKKLVETINKIFEFLIKKWFYNGFSVLKPQLAQARTQALIDQKGALRLEGLAIDALYIPSQSLNRTGNAIVFALNTTYQDVHPRQYEHYLANGADVVLWNPSILEGKQYRQDLLQVLQAMQRRLPHQQVAVKSYCASTDPAIAAVAAMDDPRISLIVDRGQGDVQKLVRSFTLLSMLPAVKRIFKDKYECGGIDRIATIRSNILFLAPNAREDQLMHYGGGKNLTYELFEKRRGHPQDTFITLQNSDHWTSWSAATHNSVNAFLRQNRILAEPFIPAQDAQFPMKKTPTFFKRNILPLLAKGWC